MAWRWVTTGEMKKDARSDTDDGSASENEGRAKPDKASAGEKPNGHHKKTKKEL